MDPTGLVKQEFVVDFESCRSHGESVSEVHSVVIDVIAEGVNADVDEKKLLKEEKRKKMSNKKPPRPPRGPLLDAADLKFIKQMTTELTVLKLIRTERIKALKKMKVDKKTSSSSYSFFATMFTIIFCCVILFQGIISNRASSNASIGASPSSLAPEPGLISVQYVGKAYAMHSSSSILVSGSPSVIEQVSGQD